MTAVYAWKMLHLVSPYANYVLEMFGRALFYCFFEESFLRLERSFKFAGKSRHLCRHGNSPRLKIRNHIGKRIDKNMPIFDFINRT